MTSLSKKVPYFTKLAPDVRDALRRYKADAGVPEAQQIDRALREWFEERGVMTKAPRPSVAARGRG